MSEDSKFAAFVAEHKLNARRILATSHQLESLGPDDRKLKLAKRRGKREGGTKEPAKPRSGRPVTPRALEAALTGGTLSGPTKSRILKAINHLLEQKKKDKVELRSLF